MKRLLVIGILGLAAVPPVGTSRDFDDCQVVEVIVAGTNNGHVRLSCNVSERPACATAGPYVGFDKSTDEGKQGGG
jgi:hypothetical protein